MSEIKDGTHIPKYSFTRCLFLLDLREEMRSVMTLVAFLMLRRLNDTVVIVGELSEGEF